MDADEEQRNEFEALEAIYADDFEVVSADPPRSFELVVVPNADGEGNHVSLRMLVELPAEYPAVQANIRLRSEKGLVERQMQELQAILEESSAAAVGEVAMYTVAEALREYLLEHNQPQLSMHAQMEQRLNVKDSEEEERLAKRRALEERIEAKKLEPSPLGIEAGTLFTPESFQHWRKLFDAEQKAIRDAKEALKPKTGKLTGKQLFMQNLAKELDDSEADQLLEAAAPKKAEGGAAPLFFDASLYEDDDDEALDDAVAESDGDASGAEQGEEEDALFDTETTASAAMSGLRVGTAAASASSTPAAPASSVPPPSKPSPTPASSKPAPPKAKQQPSSAKKEAPKQTAGKGKKK